MKHEKIKKLSNHLCQALLPKRLKLNYVNTKLFFGHEWRIIKLPSFSFDFLLSNKMFIGQIFRITREESKCSDWMLSLCNKFVLFWDVLNSLLKVNQSFEPSSSLISFIIFAIDWRIKSRLFHSISKTFRRSVCRQKTFIPWKCWREENLSTVTRTKNNAY